MMNAGIGPPEIEDCGRRRGLPRPRFTVKKKKKKRVQINCLTDLNKSLTIK